MKKDQQGARPSAEVQANLFYGRNTASELLAAGRQINKAWVLKSTGNRRPDQRLVKIINELKARRVPTQFVSRPALDRMTAGQVHQGIVLELPAFDYADLDSELDRLAQLDRPAFIIALDEVQEPYNFGSILRTAEAAGVDLVIIPERRSAGLDAHVAKASAGAIFHMPVARVVNLGRCLDRLKEDGYWVYGTALTADQDYREPDWQGKAVLVIGNEAKGISPNILNRCDFSLKIPMRGNLNSLNAAVAAGIVIYEAMNRRMQ